MAKKKQNPAKNKLVQGKGYYYGTTLGSSFWRRYKDDNLLMRGDGEIWLSRDALYFRRYFTLEPIRIPTRAITKIRIGHAHAGKLTLAPIVKIHWIKADFELVSGFLISKDINELLLWQRKFQKVIKAKFL
jgi:hypothetical protein